MPCDLPVPAVKGGAVATLVESLLKMNEAEKQVQFYVFTSGNKESESLAKQYHHTEFYHIHYHPMLLAFDKMISSKGILKKLYVIEKAMQYIKKGDFDAIILQNSGFLLKIFRNKRLLEKYKDKLFYHLHNDIPHNADRKVLKYCRFILISKYLIKGVVDLCGDGAKEKCIIVKNGINVHKFTRTLSIEEKSHLREELNIKPEQKILIFVGRINPQKGIDKLLDTMKVLDDANIVLVVIGSTNFGADECSPFEKNIRQKCLEMESQVRFTGFIHNNELWKYYQLADIAVLPSMWEEPAGLTMIEAAASGTPVITTISGGIPEYMSANCSVLVKRDSAIVQSLAEAIKGILEHEEKWRQRIAIGRKEICQCYSEEAFYQRFINCMNYEDRNTDIH